MSDPIQSFEFAKAHLKEEDAKQIQGVSENLFKTEDTITRRWIGIPAHEADGCVTYLRSILTVKDPMIERKVREGLFRVVNVHSEARIQVGNNPGEADIFQVLKKGWATTVDWTEARLVENPQLQPLGAPTYKFLTVMWPNCASTALEAMAASLLAMASFTDPVINGEPKTGKWYNSGVTSKLANDGSGILTLQLSQQYRDLSYNESTTGDIQTDVRDQLGLTTETPASNPATSSTNHVITQQRITPNADNSKNISTTKKTPLPVHVPEFIAQESEHETIYHSEEKHDASPPDITKFVNSNGVTQNVVLGTNANSVHILSHDLDDFLTHNYKKSRVVKTPPIPFGTEKTWNVWQWTESATTQAFSTNLQRWWVNSWTLWHNYRQHTMRYFTTLEEARAYIDSATGSEIIGYDQNNQPVYGLIDSTGSGWRQTGDYEYEGLKVRRKFYTLISQTYLEPTS